MERSVARFGSCVGLAAALVAVAGSGPPARAAAVAAADGIQATLRADAGGATLDWRFLHRLPAPVRSVAVNLNGRPLGVPRGPFFAFPAPGQTAALLVLTDTAVPGMPDMDAQLTALAPPGSLALRSVRFGAGSGASPGGGEAWPADLAGAIGRGIAELAGTAADRRILLVATDGFASGAAPADALAEQATAAGIALVFVLAPSPRLADTAALGRLAERTGGRVLRDDADVAAALLDSVLSGAMVRFPLGDAKRYVWERHATVTALILFGGQHLDISTEADLPPAGAGPTLELLWARARRRLPAFAAGVIVTLLGVALYRKRPHAAA